MTETPYGNGYEPILVARGVTKVYRSGQAAQAAQAAAGRRGPNGAAALEVAALRGIDLDIQRGEFLAVMGPSGSGKTTLLNCLSGLDDIDSGQVWVEGADIHAMADAKRTEHRARSMGFIFQAYNLIPVLSAAENVELPLLLTGVKPPQARSRARDMLDRVGLENRHHHRPNELSGGEQQRVAVARALVGQPAIVWADEPTGNLDSHMATAVLRLLQEVHQAGQTIVVVTHDPWIARAAWRLVRMQDGLIVADGTTAELLGTGPTW